MDRHIQSHVHNSENKSPSTANHRHMHPCVYTRRQTDTHTHMQCLHTLHDKWKRLKKENHMRPPWSTWHPVHPPGCWVHHLWLHCSDCELYIWRQSMPPPAPLLQETGVGQTGCHDHTGSHLVERPSQHTSWLPLVPVCETWLRTLVKSWCQSLKRLELLHCYC